MVARGQTPTGPVRVEQKNPPQPPPTDPIMEEPEEVGESTFNEKYELDLSLEAQAAAFPVEVHERTDDNGMRDFSEEAEEEPMDDIDEPTPIEVTDADLEEVDSLIGPPPPSAQVVVQEEEPTHESGSRAGLWIIIVLFVIGGTGAGLYFGGILPPKKKGSSEATAQGNGEPSVKRELPAPPKDKIARADLGPKDGTPPKKDTPKGPSDGTPQDPPKQGSGDDDNYPSNDGDPVIKQPGPNPGDAQNDNVEPPPRKVKKPVKRRVERRDNFRSRRRYVPKRRKIRRPPPKRRKRRRRRRRSTKGFYGGSLVKRTRLAIYVRRGGQRVFTSALAKECRRIERHVGKLLGSSSRVRGITKPWQNYVKKRFARGRRSKYVFYPRGVAYVIYKGLSKGQSRRKIEKRLISYQKRYQFKKYSNR